MRVLVSLTWPPPGDGVPLGGAELHARFFRLRARFRWERRRARRFRAERLPFAARRLAERIFRRRAMALLVARLHESLAVDAPATLMASAPFTPRSTSRWLVSRARAVSDVIAISPSNTKAATAARQMRMRGTVPTKAGRNDLSRPEVCMRFLPDTCTPSQVSAIK